MIERLGHAEFTNDEDIDEARWLRTYIGKTGFVQLGFAHQGIMMVYEASTDWYDHYQRLLELSEDFAAFPSTTRSGRRNLTQEVEMEFFATFATFAVKGF